ncbi:MAG: zf-HC2 domain-containing protein [Phycisphaerales bacterium]|jgi:outer membrane lipoprotein-sorting protein
MNCAECKELLVAYIEGLLDESQKQSVAEHLKDCRTCRDETQELTNLQSRLVNNGKTVAQSNLEDKVLNRIVREQNVRLKAAGKALKLRSIIMKSPFVKIAAAAVIIIAAMVVLNPFGSTVTFAKVVEPLLNAKTMIFDSILGDEETGTTIHEVIVGQKIRRTISNVPGMTMIVDPENSRMLVLNDTDSSAGYVDISGQVGQQHQSYLKFLRYVITKLKDNHENLGEEEIDGQKAIVFEAKGPNERIKIWADPETALPIRVELGIGQMSTILKNFQFNPQIDQSLVSMEVPAGYNLDETEFDMTGITEEDFIESLRIWAKVIGDGVFPDAIGTENAMKQVPVLGQKLGTMNLSKEEATQMGMNFGKGMIFHQSLETGSNPWQYTGQGVKLGDAGKAVFRYQPEGSSTWRVIYGDLSVKDVAEKDLPK